MPTMKVGESAKKEASILSGLFGRGRYKLWALAAILLLAFCSMLTGSVTLKWSPGNLNPLSDVSPLRYDHLDILELEDREKVVRHMWDVYSHSKTIGLPSFWQRAFEAAFEDLTSDLPAVRAAAISEIARMSLFSAAPQTNSQRSKVDKKELESGKKQHAFMSDQRSSPAQYKGGVN